MRIFLLLATIIIIAITLALTLKTKPKITPTTLQQEIQSLQQQLPIQVDAQTKLSRVEADGMAVKYFFNVLDNPTQSDVMSVNDENFAAQVETSVKTNACNNKNIRRYINSDVSLVYHYSADDDKTLANFTIPAGFCK